MKKTLIALAALAATASFAQVTLSGRASMGVDSFSATGATAGPTADYAARTRVNDYSSRLRFGVNEDLGSGLRAFAVYEFGFSYDTGSVNGQSATANSAAAFNGSRESHIGIGNSLVELRLGRQNVYWTQGDLSDAGSNYIGKDAFSDSYTRVANVRQNNAILLNLNSAAGGFAGSQLYWAPEVSNEAAPQGSPSAAQTNNATTWGGKLNWDQGKVHLMADYQKRSNIAAGPDSPNFGINATSFDATSIKLGAGYRYAAGSMVGVHYWDMKKELTDATANATATVQAVAGVQGGNITGGWKQTGWAVNVQHNLGNGLTGYANYGVLNNQNGTSSNADLDDSGSRFYTLGLRKDLSKRTGIFTSYGRINNGAAGTYSPAGGSFLPFAGTGGVGPAGAANAFFLVGMMHNF